MHFKTFGILTGTPAELKRLVTREDCQIHELVPGKMFNLLRVCYKSMWNTIRTMIKEQ